MLKNLIKKFLPKSVISVVREFKNNYLDRYAVRAYSQEGEDMVLCRLFEDKKVGFYVDVGAHHPFRFSNTCLFYKRGWRGINIDATPNSMKLFKKFRPRDINLETAISDKKETVVYYLFNEPALNTFSSEVAKNRVDRKNCKIIQEIKIETKTLAELLDEYLPPKQEIDFLTIDVEGSDFKVLKSNNWEKYRPEVILIEILDNKTIESILNSEISLFLKEKGYSIFAKLFNTVIFKRVP